MTSASPIHVCALSRVAEIVEATHARDLVTLLSPGGVEPVRPPAIEPGRHLVIKIADIAAPTPGLVHAAEEHVEALLACFSRWDRAAPLLIHCYAGVSRSTAAAYIAVCALAPHRDESEVAAALRRASPTATPNPRLVALADAALGREGRMSAAIAAIGRGVDCFEGEPFALGL